MHIYFSPHKAHSLAPHIDAHFDSCQDAGHHGNIVEEERRLSDSVKMKTPIMPFPLPEPPHQPQLKLTDRGHSCCDTLDVFDLRSSGILLMPCFFVSGGISPVTQHF